MEIAKLYEESAARILEEQRDKARKKWRIPYDCFHAKNRNGFAVCDLGKWTQKVALLTILKGRSKAVCQYCKDYDSD